MPGRRPFGAGRKEACAACGAGPVKDGRPGKGDADGGCRERNPPESGLPACSRDAGGIKKGKET